jgi:hypothetical protein
MAANATQRGTFVTNWRAAINQLIQAADNLRALNEEYVANGYSGTLVNGDMVGANAGILAADVISSVTNGLLMAQAVTDNLGHTIPAGGSTAIYTVR